MKQPNILTEKLRFALLFSTFSLIKHQIGWFTACFQLTFHELHVLSDLLEKLAIAITEIIVPRLSIAVINETIARTLAMTGK